MKYLLGGNRLPILECLNQIKVGDVKILNEMLNSEIKIHTIRRTLKKLENYNIIKSIVLPCNNNKKFYIPTKKTQDYFSENVLITSHSNLYHNIMLGKIMYELSKHSNIVNYTILGDIEVDKNSLVPDAVLTVSNNGKCHKFAIELELTRKNVKRYTTKFKNYNNDKAYTGVIYIFDNAGVFNSYKKRVIETFEDLTRCNVFLLNLPSVELNNINLFNNCLFLYGKEVRVQSFIGEKDYVQ